MGVSLWYSRLPLCYSSVSLSLHVYLCVHASQGAIGCKSLVFTPPDVLIECKSTILVYVQIVGFANLT